LTARARLAAFELVPVPSRCWLALTLIAAALGAGLLGYHAPDAAAVLLLLPPYLGWLLRRDGWLGGRHAIERITVDGTGCLRVWRAGTARPARVEDDSLVLPWLIVLAVREDGRRRARLVLWPDSADREAQRQLAVYLRCFLDPV
jgi:hypothetical protein